MQFHPPIIGPALREANLSQPKLQLGDLSIVHPLSVSAHPQPNDYHAWTTLSRARGSVGLGFSCQHPKQNPNPQALIFAKQPYMPELCRTGFQSFRFGRCKDATTSTAGTANRRIKRGEKNSLIGQCEPKSVDFFSLIDNPLLSLLDEKPRKAQTQSVNHVANSAGVMH